LTEVLRYFDLCSISRLRSSMSKCLSYLLNTIKIANLLTSFAAWMVSFLNFSWWSYLSLMNSSFNCFNSEELFLYSSKLWK